MFPKVDYQTYLNFRNDFYNKNKYPYLRFGQAFLNVYFPSELNSILYYANNRDAEQIIEKEWVNYQ